MGLNWGAGLQAAGQSLGQWAAYQQQLDEEKRRKAEAAALHQQMLGELAADNARLHGGIVPMATPGMDFPGIKGSPDVPVTPYSVPAITTFDAGGKTIPIGNMGGMYVDKAVDLYDKLNPQFAPSTKPVVPPINYVVTDSSGAQTPFSTTDAPDAVVGRMTEGDRRAVLSGVGPDGAIHITTSTVAKEPRAPTSGEELNKQKYRDAQIASTATRWAGNEKKGYRDAVTVDEKGKRKIISQEMSIPSGGSLFNNEEIGYMAAPDALNNSLRNALTDSLDARGLFEWPKEGLPPELPGRIKAAVMPQQTIAPMSMPDVAKVLGLPSNWQFDQGKNADSTADDRFIVRTNSIFRDKRLTVPEAIRQALANKANDLGYLDHESVKKTLMDYGIDLDSLFKGGSGVAKPKANTPNLSPQGVSKPGQIDKSLLEDALGIKSGA